MNRERFFGLLTRLNAGGLVQVQGAYWLAKNAHRMQQRDGGERYFEHPRRVAIALVESGDYDADTLCLALCHDVVEDSNTPAHVIVDLFDAAFWRDLATLSKYVPLFDPVTGQIIGRVKKPLEEYFAAIAGAALRVRRVKLFDRLDNLGTMKAEWPAPRRAAYLDETRARLLPIAVATDARLATTLEAAMRNAETSS